MVHAVHKAAIEDAHRSDRTPADQDEEAGMEERESEKNMTGEEKEKLPLCVLENSLQLWTLLCIFVATDGLWR